MRLDEMITADELRALAAQFHTQYGLYLVLDDHLLLTNPKRTAEGIRALAGLVGLVEIEESIDPEQIDPPAISASTARDLKELEELRKALR